MGDQVAREVANYSSSKKKGGLNVHRIVSPSKYNNMKQGGCNG